MVTDSEDTVTLESADDSILTQVLDDGATGNATPSNEAVDADGKDNKRVEDTRQALKDEQAKFHAMKSEMAETAKELAYLKGEAETIKALRTEDREAGKKDC